MKLRSSTSLALALTVMSTVAFVSSSARAQDTGASTTATATTPPPPPPPTGTGTAEASPGGTDHSRVVGHLAVGFMGVNSVGLGQGTYATGNCGLPGSTVTCRPELNGSTDVPAPTIGVRYWINDMIGIDAGLGFGMYSGSTKSYPYSDDPVNQDVEDERDKPAVRAFLFHVGVPLALSQGRHYTFEVIPEANVGFASGTVKDQRSPPRAGEVAPPTRTDIELGGFQLDVGARVGSEIHFGFIGVPELALVGTVGLYFSQRSVKVTADGKDATDSNTSIYTSVQSAPWALFTNSIAALYYF